MTVQMTVRIPDELAAFVDGEVARGTVSSRAEAVTRALVRERRRQIALADVEILRGTDGADPYLDELAAHMSAHPVDLGD